MMTGFKSEKNAMRNTIKPIEKDYSSYLTLTVQMKNWLPLVSGPALAMLKTPGPTCFTAINAWMSVVSTIVTVIQILSQEL